MRKLHLYNTLTKSPVPFEPIEEGKISMYICGPTVYDSPHIGHARTYISFDIIRKILSRYFNYDVTLTMNITNIDDKIINRAAERNISCDELSQKYEDEFFNEMDKLGVERPDFTTRVTEYVEECVSFIEKLEENGFAYEANGSVYFDLQEYKKKYKHNLLRPEFQAKEAADEEEAKGEKRNKEDFVLWKASKEGEPMYKTKWGPGRPGWHIECSAMAYNIFGSKLDIHAGGIDLAFPHHENEIAQCQGYSGEKWVNYFLHTGHLNINGLKMSKSLKNFLTISDILSISSPVNLRILFLQHLWNKDMNYDAEQLKEADAIRKRIFNFISNCMSYSKKNDKVVLSQDDRKILANFEQFKDEVNESLANNLNTAKVLELILELINNLNVGMPTIHSDVLRRIVKYMMYILGIFGIAPEVSSSISNEEAIAKLLVGFRNDIRKAAMGGSSSRRYFELSDGVREHIKVFNYVIDDNKEGSILRKI